MILFIIFLYFLYFYHKYDIKISPDSCFSLSLFMKILYTVIIYDINYVGVRRYFTSVAGADKGTEY